MVNILSVYYHFILCESAVIILGRNIKSSGVNENELVKGVHLVDSCQIVCKIEKMQIYDARNVDRVV